MLPDKTENKSNLSKGDDSLDTNPIKFRQPDGTLAENAHDKDYMELTLRSGKHSDLVKRLLRQRIEARAREFPRWPASATGGVRAMWIESRFWYDRERLIPDFDNDWRKYRAKYLKSLELDPREPVHVPEYERWLINPIRRFYMKGGDFLEDKILMKFTDERLKASMWRVLVTRGMMLYFGAMGVYYWIRYNHRKWDKTSGILIHASAPIIYADHPDYPFKDYRTEPAHHYDLGFTRRKVFKDLRDYEDRTVAL
jgi:hypothetical protein